MEFFDKSSTLKAPLIDVPKHPILVRRFALMTHKNRPLHNLQFTITVNPPYCAKKEDKTVPQFSSENEDDNDD